MAETLGVVCPRRAYPTGPIIGLLYGRGFCELIAVLAAGSSRFLPEYTPLGGTIAADSAGLLPWV